MEVISIEHNFDPAATGENRLINEIDIDLKSLYNTVHSRDHIKLKYFNITQVFVDGSANTIRSSFPVAWIEPQTKANSISTYNYDVAIAAQTDVNGVVSKSNKICNISNGNAWHGQINLFDKIKIGYYMVCNNQGAAGDKYFVKIELGYDV